MHFARKVTAAKWERARLGQLGSALTPDLERDLRTGDGELSLWECGEAGADRIEDVALALAAANDRIDKLDLTWFSEVELHQCGVTWTPSEGRTPIVDLRH